MLSGSKSKKEAGKKAPLLTKEGLGVVEFCKIFNFANSDSDRL